MKALIEEFILFLESCRDGQDWLSLGGVGCFSAQSYAGYSCTNPITGKVDILPPKREPVFRPDSNLVRQLNGLPPLPRVFPDERSMLYSPDARPRREFTVTCSRTLEPLARELRASLESTRAWENASLGTFSVRQRRALLTAASSRVHLRVHVQFGQELKARVQSAGKWLHR